MREFFCAVGGVELRLGEAGVDEDVVDVFHVGVVVAEAAVFVFDLDGDDGAAVADLEGRDFLAETQEPGARGGEELRIARAHDHGGIFEEPGGKAAEFPLGAGVGAGAEDDVEAFLLGFADELGDVEVAGEVVDAGARLVGVPEDVGGDGVQAHGFRHAQAVAPVFARDAGVVHFAGDDAEGFAVEEELAIGGAEGVLLGACWTDGENGEKRDGRGGNGEAKRGSGMASWCASHGSECGLKGEQDSTEEVDGRGNDEADDAAAEDENEEEADQPHRVIEAQSLVGEHVAEDVGAIERRQREQVEGGEDEVEEHREIKHEDERVEHGAGGHEGWIEAAGTGNLMHDVGAAGAGAGEEEHEQRRADGGEQVAAGTGDGGEDVVAGDVFEIGGRDGSGLGPSEEEAGVDDAA